MGTIQELFAQYSIESLIILILTLIAAIKFGWDLISWAYEKVKNYFNYKSVKDTQHNELVEGLQDIKTSIDSIDNRICHIEEEVCTLKDNDEIHNKQLELNDKKVQLLTEQMQTANERLQENARNFIIDKHHYFYYEIKAIDDLSLQSLERRYLYYKMAGGNSFIDGLMAEIRELPRVNLQNKKIVETIQQGGV